MPKVMSIDAKTGAPSAEISVGRHIKAQTQPFKETPPSPPQAPAEGQNNKTDGSSPEAIPLDPKFEALAKKEASFRAKEREFQSKEAALEARVKAAVDEALGQYRGRLKAAPLDVLNEDGITYDQLVEQAVNAPDSTTREIQTKLKAIEDAQKKMVEDAQNGAKSQREAAVKQIRYDVTDLVEADAQFETIKATGSIDDVVELITKVFDETGKLMTVEQAAQKVEEELFEEAKKIAGLAKVKASFKPELTPETLQQAKQQSSQKQPMTTLTNNMTSTRPLTSRERAIKRFKGEAF